MLCFTLVSLTFFPLCNLVAKLFTSTGIVVCRYSQSNAVSHGLGTPCRGSVLEFVSPASDQPETGTAVFCLQVEQREKSQVRARWSIKMSQRLPACAAHLPGIWLTFSIGCLAKIPLSKMRRCCWLKCTISCVCALAFLMCVPLGSPKYRCIGQNRLKRGTL